MKQRPHPLPEKDTEAAIDGLARAFAALTRPADVRAFLEDACTPAELESISDRWRVVPLLLDGMPYREIHDRTGVSVTTVGRVARTLERGAGGYDAANRAAAGNAGTNCAASGRTASKPAQAQSKPASPKYTPRHSRASH